MKLTKKLALSGAAIAVLTGLSANASPVLKSVPHNTKDADAPLSFGEWRDQQRHQRYADVTDQIVVTFASEKAAKAALGMLPASMAKAGEMNVMGELSRQAGVTLKARKGLDGNRVVMGLGNEMDLKAVKMLTAKLAKHKGVKGAEADPRRYPMAEMQPWGIGAVQGDLVSDNEAGNMNVCIIDSGYDISNPDLANNQVSGTNDSGTGSWSTPGGSHGTHVAGTIAAVNNTQGVVGVLPNQNVNLHIIKVFNESGWAYSTDLVGAIQKCQNAGSNVVNMSLGGASSSTSERNSLQGFYDDGMLLIAAAGNDGDNTHSYPASYDSVISVAAVDESGKHAEFSQYTSQVELSGPGEAILSTVGVGDGRQGYITFNGSTTGDDRVLPQSRYVPSGSSYAISNVNGTVSGVLAACSRSGSSYSCGDMSGKICVAERHANQSGSSYPEVDPAEACANAGASGVVVYSNTERPGLQNPFLVDANQAVDVPTVSVNRTLGQSLVAAAGTNATLQVAANTDYAYYNGTSMATPHVSGVAALAWSKNPTCTAQEVRAALAATADDLDTAGRDNRTGYGMVQTQAASNYMASNCAGTGGGGGTGGGTETLANNVAETGLSGAKDAALNYVMNVPANATDLSFTMSGGTGDADMYVRFGSEPTTTTYDCRPYETGNNEVCNFATPSEGTYYVKVLGYSAFSGVELVGSYTEGSTGGGTGGQGATAEVTDISASRNNWNHYTWDVPAGMSQLSVVITGGTGDADLYVRFGSQPTTSSYDCRPYESGNEEVCTFTNPQAGTWHFGVRAYQTYSGVTLQASYQP
ncbi:S8 family serine peptidase [Fluctibacter halophilus]|nr:S8 family serine peptidase [Aestuariibacter halophilus]